ncbi:MAG TPA: cadherin-like domain-containing protein, partial [Allosphingosinicella sp.]|nr:cadherin-like domain-containing protein [Allosphingosinicella sp.]
MNAVSIAPTDNGRYNGTTSGTASALRSGMNTDTNWTTDVNPLSPHGVAAITVLNPGMLSVNDVTLAEGNSGTTSFVFTITRTGGSDGAVGATWTLTTIFGGNVDAADFVTYPQSGTVSFANGETSQQITIQVQGDTIVEPDEAFTVTLSAPTGGVTTSNLGVGRILNDDVASISIDDISHAEGDNGSTVYTFTVTRSGGSAGAAGATWTIGFPGGAGSANSGDLAAGQGLTGTVSFADGETSKTITVNVNGDYLPEDIETFNVTLSAPTGGVTISDATGVGTITNDDFPGAISIDDVSHAEGDGGTTLYTFTVSRTGQAANTSVQWALGGTAGATDFPTSQALSGTITFAGGETSRTIIVSVLGDHLYEPDEGFTVTLSNPSAGATIADGTGIGTIVNDDAAPPFVPDGAETIVNQTLALEQLSSRVAWIDAGHYVVTWNSHVALTDDYEVMARLFNADGTPAGNEFQVNTVSVGDQIGGRVALLSGGGFVIVWADGITADIHAQMYNADGTPNGTELALNTDPLHAQSLPWVAALAGGGFVATWMHDDGVSIDVRARTFGADGLPVSAEIPVNTNTNLAQQYAQVTSLSNGHFVVVWQDGSGIGGDAGSTGIKMRIFDGAGVALTAETLVNTTIASTQQFPTVAALAGGGYVVAWEDYSASGGDISGNALRAQIFDASGNALGSEFIVNFTTEGDQSRPTIAGLPDGGFVIGWWNQADGVGVNEIRAQTFDALGNRRGGEFEVNSDSFGDQLGPALAVSANGQLVATWTDFNDSQELTDGEIEQRLFTLPAPGALSIADLSRAEGDSGPSSFTFTVTRAGGSLGIVGATWTLILSGDADAADFTTFPQTGTISFADGETSQTITILVQGDTLFEPGESFAVLLSAPTGGATIADDSGQGTISNDDPMLAPAVDLDGGAGGIDYDGSFTEGSAAGIGVSIQVVQGTFPITSATITLTDGLAGDSLTIVGTLPLGITNISGNDQQIQLVGINISAAEWATALAQIAFASSSDNPDNYGTDTARTIIVEVSDGFTISATATATIAIHAVNDAPTVGALDGDSVTWTEGNAYVLLDQNMPATVVDPDNQNFGGGFVSFGVQINPAAEDEFFVLDSFPGVGAMGNEVYVGGTHIGTITSSGAGQVLTIGFNAEATAARVAILLHAIAYRNAAGDVPTAGTRSVSYVLNDGQSGASGGVITLNIVAVNDGPIVADTNIAIVEDQVWVLSLADFDIVDPEGDAIATITITGVTGGTIYYDADGAGAGEPEAVTVYPRTFSFGDIAAGLLSWVPEAGVSGDDSSYFQYGVTDDRGAASAGARVYFDIAPVTDSPTVDLNGPDEADTYFEAAYAEGGAGAAIADSDVAITSESGVLTGATITITDAAAGDLLSVSGTLPGLITAVYDPDTATLTLSGQGTVEQYQAALTQILYSSTSEDPDAAGSDTQRTIEIVVTDGVVDGAPSSAPVYAYVSVTGEIDNPAIGNLDGDLATFSEGNAFALLDTGGDATVADLDNVDFSGGTLTVSFNGTGLSQDRFDVASNDSVSLTPGSVIVGGVTIGSWGGGFPGGDFTVDFNGNATSERIQALLRALAYRNGAGDTPTAGLRDVLITLTDGDGGTVSTASHIEVAGVNDAPTLGANAGLTLAEGATATITAAMLDYNDAEQADGAITYTLGAVVSGIVRLNGIALNAGGSFTQAQVNSGVVTFEHDGGETSSASFAFSVSDGAGGLVAGQSFAIAVTPVNDAPVVTTTAGTTAYAESVNTAPGTVAVNNALTVTDADDIALVGARVSITGNYQLGQDILAFTNDNAAIFGNISAFYNVGTGVLTLTSPDATATLAQWQAALREVTYSNSSEEPNQAVRTISFMAFDGDAESALATRLLSVTAQNDSPSGADATRTIDEDSSFTFTAAHFGFSDVDGDAFAGVRFGAAPVGGTLYFDADGAGGNPPLAITSFPTTIYSAADIAAGKLTFVPTANLNGTGAASVSFTVIDNGGTVGAGQNADTIPNTLSFDIVSVNDAPSGADKTITINEDSGYTLTVADFGYSDVDGNAFEAVIFSSNVTGGTLYINGNPLTNVTLVYLHTIQSGVVVFVPTANATGAAGSITFTVRDDGGFDNGGQAADTTPNTLTFSMTAVNDAPTNTVPGGQTINEDASLTLSTGNGNAISVVDVDA